MHSMDLCISCTSRTVSVETMRAHHLYYYDNIHKMRKLMPRKV